MLQTRCHGIEGIRRGPVGLAVVNCFHVARTEARIIAFRLNEKWTISSSRSPLTPSIAKGILLGVGMHVVTGTEGA